MESVQARIEGVTDERLISGISERFPDQIRFPMQLRCQPSPQRSSLFGTTPYCPRIFQHSQSFCWARPLLSYKCAESVGDREGVSLIEAAIPIKIHTDQLFHV